MTKKGGLGVASSVHCIKSIKMTQTTLDRMRVSKSFQRDDDQSKAVCIRPHYVATNCAASLVHREKSFFVPMQKEGKKKTFIVFADSTSHWVPRSVTFKSMLSAGTVCFRTHSCFCKHIGYHSQILSQRAKERKLGGNSVLHGSLRSAEWLQLLWNISAISLKKQTNSHSTIERR